MFFSVLSIIFIKVRINVKWEQHKLGEVVSVFDGTHQTPNYKTKGIMFLSVENINTLLSNKYISENEYRQRFKIKPQYLDVFMTRIGTIGKTNVITTHKPIAYYVSLALLRPQNIQSFFLSFIIQTSKVQQDIWKRTLQIAFPQKINKDEIGKVTLALPLQKEQIDIEKLLLKLDKLITLQQRKLEQLKLLEKAHQQKLFPNSFQEKPLLRILHGDNSWWNSYIGEVFTERVDKGSSEKLLSVSITDGVYPFDESKRKNNSSDDKHNYKKVFQNDIAYNSMRLWQGALGVSKYEGIVSPAYTVLKPLPNQNSIFYEFMFKNIDMLHIFQRNSQGLTSDTWNLKFNQLQHIKIKTTNLNSQNKIAKLLIKIEELKNNESNYYHNLMTLKKYLLQKLFL
ncbi:restriction endonuclease subunit S [Limosilactobacillus reuteri]|uniref:Restriction endonuclease subunit S n=1 Tax=Limosilactobacillus reuteri TaxID=1598 RepID=A0ABD6Y895_LIMRT|nr:restriction endonuclease subunit S [Limosilactobacillus reuteri]MCT3189074.1 restriction endonuclease subunit S [Limosilactobacillus reuteri]MCT3202878.1 restriction endonuclease subunit S [Limosilactobacillus reuteri]MCT3211447.1 restriction endonuclease subunit S [Limosilactobacillus reuteri]PWT37862.1 restriction endonuclease subunit S [Limosilactobacillus reuteri]TSB18762.1 restriction endonuclease subunit S [Limosilactobacillus reuteri]